MIGKSRKVIAIDGTAASGKGTLARVVAQRLGYAYLDTGKLYRYVGYTLLSRGLSHGKDAAIAIQIAKDLRNNLTSEDLQNPDLKTDAAGQAASKVAAISGVRDALVDYQRNFAENPPDNAKGAVLDGRDIGTIICPNAQLKLYITAKTEIRAQRRYKELQLSGISVTYEAVLVGMQERDTRDAERETAPMKPADDAIVIDTGDMNIEEVLNTAFIHIKDRLGIC